MFSISFSCFFRFSRFSALSIHHFLNPTQTAPGSHPRVPGAQGRGAAVHRADAEALPSPLLPQRPPRLRHAACNRRRMPRGAGTEGSRAGVPSRGGAGRGPPGSWPVSHRRLGLEPRFHSAAGRREERRGVLSGHGCGARTRGPYTPPRPLLRAPHPRCPLPGWAAVVPPLPRGRQTAERPGGRQGRPREPWLAAGAGGGRGA